MVIVCVRLLDNCPICILGNYNVGCVWRWWHWGRDICVCFEVIYLFLKTNRACTEMRPDYPAASVYVTSVGATAVVASTSGFALVFWSHHSNIIKLTELPLEVMLLQSAPNPLITASVPPVILKMLPCVVTALVLILVVDFPIICLVLHIKRLRSTIICQVYVLVLKYISNSYANICQGVKLPPKQYWNSTNRGYPDVSAVGADVLIVSNGSMVLKKMKHRFDFDFRYH